MFAAALAISQPSFSEEKAESHGSNSHVSSEGDDAPLTTVDDVALTYAGPPAIVRDIRSLFALQDAAANGNRSAVELQKAMIAQIGGELLREEWRQDAERFAPSVAAYVLSGGNPEVAERLSESGHLGNRSRHLLKGAALYMRGKAEEAGTELSHLKIEELPPPIGGRVALAQAMLAASNPDMKQLLLQTAIALMPGSLLEESALRRSALSYAESGNQMRFWKRADRYIRRFPRSLYAPEFMFEIIRTIVALESAGKMPDLQRLDLLLGKLDAAKRRTLYTELARHAAASNLVALSKFAARRLRRLAAPDSPDAHLAEVYDWIFEVASPNPNEAVARLRNIKVDLLSSRERSLLAAALTVIRQIEEPAQPGDSIGEYEKDMEKTAVHRRAAEILQNASALLEGMSQ